MMSVVIDVYKFGHEIFTIDIFRKFLYKYLGLPKVNSSQSCIKRIFAELKDYKQPAKIKLLHPKENFVQQAEI